MKLVKPILALLVASSLAVVDAQAIGKTEKGVLIGAGALLLLPSLLQGARNLNQQPQQQVIYQQQPVVYAQPQPVYQQPVQREVVREVIYVEQPPRMRGGYQERRHNDRYDQPYRRKTIIIER